MFPNLSENLLLRGHTSVTLWTSWESVSPHGDRAPPVLPPPPRGLEHWGQEEPGGALPGPPGEKGALGISGRGIATGRTVSRKNPSVKA